MKIIMRLRRQHYLVTVSAFFIIVALIAGMMGCYGNFVGGSEPYMLTITSTFGGSVTEPGEGTFTYNATTVVNLVAEADEGYYFAGWAGDTGAIANTSADVTAITMEDDHSITANFVDVESGYVGIETGDWVKLNYTYTGWPAGESYPDWLKLEFLSVQGTNATVRFTQHVSDGTEQSDTASIDISRIQAELLAGIVIPAHRTKGDSVYITGYGNATIEDETTGFYAGANRTVVYTSFSYDEGQVTYHWDKLTGVMVEVSSIYSGFTAAAKAAATNMWGTPTTQMPRWPWIIIAVVGVGLVIFFVRRKRTVVRRRKPTGRKKKAA